MVSQGGAPFVLRCRARSDRRKGRAREPVNHRIVAMGFRCALAASIRLSRNRTLIAEARNDHAKLYWTCLGLVDTWFKLLGAAEHRFSRTPSG
jgi:hypothetical protein